MSPRAKPVVKKSRPAPKPKQSKPKQPAPRKDLGAPINSFFARQPAALRPILVELRKLVEETVPDATSSIKWGMPFFEIDGVMMCALGGHKAHVNLILAGPPGSYADPQGLLSGDGTTGRRLKLVTLDDLPREAVRGWVRTAATIARTKA